MCSPPLCNLTRLLPSFRSHGNVRRFCQLFGEHRPWWGISRVIEHLQSTEIAAMLWEIAGSSFAGVVACSVLLYLLV